MSFLLFTAICFFPSGLTAHADTSLSGVALKSPTNVYESTSTSSTVLKDYSKGTVLVYKPYNDSWYSATVKVNGTWKKGYIHKADVEDKVDNPVRLKGVALDNPTAVYSQASSNSKRIKSYSKGSILYYNTFSSDWYEATVYVNGKPVTGYIAKSAVENSIQDQQTKTQLALKNKTSVYSSASTSSKAIKSYSAGSKLKFKTFSSDWYEATVYVNGKKRTGYIHHSHVEPAAQDSSSLKGVAAKKTPIYKEATKDGGIWKSYSKGSVLYYRTFSKNWYQATIYVSGKKKTGYIHKNDVENAVENSKSLQGIGLKDRTIIYTDASTSSKQVKSYPAGTILKYRTFVSGWYEATVYVNGKKKTGYISSSHVEGLLPEEQKSLDARALKSPTRIYSRASKSSSSLKSYKEGSILKVRTLSKNWYEVTVYVNGKKKTGYLAVSDVTTGDITNVTNYDYSLDYMVDQQMKYGGPKADGAGKVKATEDEVAYYVNPANFTKGTQAYYQFLDLTQPAGLKVKEINENILKGKGSLEGTGQAFIDAGKKYNINEAYLIAHTLHETGNGKSTLASGVKVDAKGNVVSDGSKAAHTVYNMYGYGAKDSCPLECGAKYAFDQGWFKPEDAILGGAGKVSENYISRGQDTLYKMKWNPEKPATHQYATHVQWAVIQTKRIAEIYNSLDNYILVYDVPKFTGATKPSSPPDTSGESMTEYPANVFGVTTTESSNLNLRDDPDGDIIGSIPPASKIEVHGTNGTWHKVTYSGKTGWVHGDYVDFLNLLEVTVNKLNVRETPNGTLKSQIDKQLVAGVLDKDNNLIRQDEWYNIYHGNNKYWISGGKDATEYVTVK